MDAFVQLNETSSKAKIKINTRNLRVIEDTYQRISIVQMTSTRAPKVHCEQLNQVVFTTVQSLDGLM